MNSKAQHALNDSVKTYIWAFVWRTNVRSHKLLKKPKCRRKTLANVGIPPKKRDHKSKNAWPAWGIHRIWALFHEKNRAHNGNYQKSNQNSVTTVNTIAKWYWLRSRAKPWKCCRKRRVSPKTSGGATNDVTLFWDVLGIGRFMEKASRKAFDRQEDLQNRKEKNKKTEKKHEKAHSSTCDLHVLAPASHLAPWCNLSGCPAPFLSLKAQSRSC